MPNDGLEQRDEQKDETTLEESVYWYERLFRGRVCSLVSVTTDSTQS